jgi:hypothetical protein
MMHGHKNLKDLVLITISLLPISQASRYADHSFPRIIKSTLLKVGTAIVWNVMAGQKLSILNLQSGSEIII